MVHDWIEPVWPAPATVRVVTTTRSGGVSSGPYASMNLAGHVEDDPANVQANRERLQQVLELPGQPRWLEQVHGCDVIDAAASTAGTPRADAAITASAGVVCAVMTADCLPVVLCDRAGSRVAVAHAGWRGLVGGVIEQTVQALRCDSNALLAWLGPAIGPQAFAVGDEVRDAFMSSAPEARLAFVRSASGKLHGDLYELARQRLDTLGVQHVFGGDWCTYSESDRFYSYRREGITGRMATLAWLASG